MNWNVWRFEDPALLLLLLALPLLTGWLFRYGGGGRIRYSAVTLVKAAGRPPSWIAQYGMATLRLCALGLLVVAWARPQGGSRTSEIISEGVDIQLVVDTSGSMEALDFTLGGQRVTRLEVAKNVVEDFIQGRANDRIGLVVFGGTAITQCPLTTDYGILLTLLEDLQIGMMGKGTAVGDAVGIAVQRLKGSKSKSRIAIVLTDGRNNAGVLQPDQAAQIARTFGVKVYTIGVGTEGKAPFRVQGLFGDQLIYQDADLDEAMLREVAKVSGGQYFRATDTTSLKRVYQTIDALEKTEIRTKEHTRYAELYPLPLGLAALLLLVEMVLSATRYRRIP